MVRPLDSSLSAYLLTLRQRCHLRLRHRHSFRHWCSLQDKQSLHDGLCGRPHRRRCCRRLRFWCRCYLRCMSCPISTVYPPRTDSIPGFPRLLRRPGLFAPTRQIKRCHRLVIDLYFVLCSSNPSQASIHFDNLSPRFPTIITTKHHHFCFLGAAFLFLPIKSGFL
jgi:hypothetical protein